MNCLEKMAAFLMLLVAALLVMAAFLRLLLTVMVLIITCLWRHSLKRLTLLWSARPGLPEENQVNGLFWRTAKMRSDRKRAIGACAAIT